MSNAFHEETKFQTIPPKQADFEEEYDENAEYEDLSYGDSDNGNNNSQGDVQEWGISQREISIPSNLTGLRSEIEAKAKELNLTIYDTVGTKMVFMGEGHALNGMNAYLAQLSAIMDNATVTKVALGEHIQKQIPLTSSFKHFKPLIDKIAERLELVIEYDETKMTVHGFERRVKELMCFLFEKESEYGEGQYIDREINISTFHRTFQNEIEQKTKALGLKHDFGYDIISVRGPRKLVDELILYLMKLETKAKKALFPQYWDFTDHKPLSLIPIIQGTDEFKLVETPFLKTMSSAKILSLHRIQNKYLMDQFITVIHKKMEERPNDLNRMLLFHGTRQNLPERIYGNFDTGFDLQYAAYGMYGKGIYFANNSNYSNGYAFTTKNGTKQMFLADVFVGKYFQGGNSSQVKAPVGYDSVHVSSSGFYIVYHNFYSYPLYLIEYK